MPPATFFRILTALLLSGASFIAAQKSPSSWPYVPTQWTVRDGLPVNRLAEVELVQTRDGYLWIGTRDGLVRFDGLHFTRFTTDNTHGLPADRIVHMLATPDGALWLSTGFGHVVRYCDRVFTTYPFDDARGERVINALTYGPDGRIWAATSRGVSVLQNGKMIPFQRDVLRVPVNHVAVTQDGSIYVATARNGLIRIQGTAITRFTRQDGLLSDEIHRLVEDDRGRLWIQHGPTASGVSVFDRGTIKTHISDGGAPATLHHDRQGRLWMAAGKSLYRFLGGSWQVFDPGGPLRDLLAHNEAAGLSRLGELVPPSAVPPLAGFTARTGASESTPFLRDHEGNLWIASHTDGLFRYTPAQVHTITDFPDPNLYAIAESRSGALWFGSLEGRLSWLTKDGRMTHVDGGRPVTNSVMAVYEDGDGNVWAGQGVCRPRGACSAYQPVSQLNGTRVRAVAEYPAGTLWFGTEDGLFRFIRDRKSADPTVGSWRRFTRSDGLPRNQVQVVRPSKRGGLWLGTDGGGLTRFKDNRFTTFTTADGLSSNRIRALVEDEQGVLWVGTEDFGLNRVELTPAGGKGTARRARISVYQEKDGLYDNGIHTILIDPDRLWMSTNRGIFWVRRGALEAFAAGRVRRFQSTAYTGRDGMADQEANGGSMHSAIRARNLLWFATQNGVAVLNPSTVRTNQTPPAVIIESAVARHLELSLAGEQMNLKRGVRDFEISYTGISLAAPDRVRFRYRLEGFDRSWVEAGTRRTGYYTNVPPGTYQFQVLAANNDGVWNNAGDAITVHVPAYLYEMFWFRLLAYLGTVGGLAFAAWRRHESMRRRERELVRRVEEHTCELRLEKEKTEAQAQRLLELDGLKNQFFANISHEFRTPLSLIIGPLQELISGRFGALPEPVSEHHGIMLRNSRRLLRMINQILDVARLESGTIRPRRSICDFEGLLQGIVASFSGVAELRSIQLAFRSAETERLYLNVDRDQMEKVFANLISNALKFTPDGGSVVMELRSDERQAVVTVSDTGCGISIDEQDSVFERFYQVGGTPQQKVDGSGIGLSLVKTLVELHGGKVGIESATESGSIFTVMLPLSENSPTGGDGMPVAGLTPVKSETLELELSAAPVPDAPIVLSPPDERTTILLVEDNSDMRVFLRSLLQDSYRILEAADGLDGLAIAESELPDLVISDVMMPGMDGLALNSALKEHPDLSCVPVILLTARAAIEEQVAGFDAQVDAYVIKPFEPAVLQAQVRTLLNLRHRLRDRLRAQAGARPLPTLPTAPEPSALERRAKIVVLEHMARPEFDVEYLASEIALSSSQLRRRFVEEVGITPSAFIRQIRLEEAARMLSQEWGNISEVAFAVGFESLSHFTRTFKNQFGRTPSSFIKETTGGDTRVRGVD